MKASVLRSGQQFKGLLSKRPTIDLNGDCVNAGVERVGCRTGPKHVFFLDGYRLSPLKSQLLEFVNFGRSLASSFHEIDNVVHHKYFIALGLDRQRKLKRLAGLNVLGLKHKVSDLYLWAGCKPQKLHGLGMALLDERAKRVFDHPTKLGFSV